MRCLVLTAALMLTGCVPAHAIDVPVWGTTGSPDVEGPVVAGDGTIVLGLATTPGHVNAVAVSPRLDNLRTLMSFGKQPKGAAFTLGLTATDRGVLVSDDTWYSSAHCCSISVASASVTWFPTFREPGQVIRSCTGCSTSGWIPPFYRTASDGVHAFIIEDGNGGFQASVRDLRSGIETPVKFETEAVPELGNRGPQIGGSYVTYPALVINWQTGDVVRHVRLNVHGLLADGTLIYASDADIGRDDHVLRWGPTDAEPTTYPRPGQLLAIANDRLLVYTPAGIEIWLADGTVIANLGPIASGRLAFDGTRAITVDRACTIVRIKAVIPGQAASPPPGPCATPVVNAISITRHSAHATVRCPRRYPQGCIGTIKLAKPRPPGTKPRTVALHAGDTTTLELARWKRGQVCATISRAKRWQLRVAIPREDSDPVTKRFSVPRRTRCDKSS